MTCCKHPKVAYGISQLLRWWLLLSLHLGKCVCIPWSGDGVPGGNRTRNALRLQILNLPCLPKFHHGNIWCPEWDLNPQRLAASESETDASAIYCAIWTYKKCGRGVEPLNPHHFVVHTLIGHVPGLFATIWILWLFSNFNLHRKDFQPFLWRRHVGKLFWISLWCAENILLAFRALPQRQHLPAPRFLCHADPHTSKKWYSRRDSNPHALDTGP